MPQQEICIGMHIHRWTGSTSQSLGQYGSYRTRQRVILLRVTMACSLEVSEEQIGTDVRVRSGHTVVL